MLRMQIGEAADMLCCPSKPRTHDTFIVIESGRMRLKKIVVFIANTCLNVLFQAGQLPLLAAPPSISRMIVLLVLQMDVTSVAKVS